MFTLDNTCNKKELDKAQNDVILKECSLIYDKRGHISAPFIAYLYKIDLERARRLKKKIDKQQEEKND